MVWQALISPVANLVGGYLNNKHEQAQAKHQAKLQVIQNDADWESKMAQASNNSWKDEFWTIVLAVPLFCLGYSVVADDASIVDRVRYSFDVLSTLPDCCLLYTSPSPRDLSTSRMPSSA